MCAVWDERTLKELDPLVVHCPLYRPEAPSDLEEEFYETRRRELDAPGAEREILHEARRTRREMVAELDASSGQRNRHWREFVPKAPRR
ncbi:hypothetical protein C440_04873 [Haloferax mucosum ATCC BAA-1512]|uniref:Uncharacterized protein n=1 Tax=Haloferax mucosum ATCC BAA-1512 TaxID=662479 RepID=M0IK92_9EURY|nr:hypothetical protein C440_04873 [Haloferax mucosum ATCC BAA-1512]